MKIIKNWYCKSIFLAFSFLFLEFKYQYPSNLFFTDRISESMWILNNIFSDILEELRKWSYYLEEPCGHCEKYSPLPDLRSTSNTRTTFNPSTLWTQNWSTFLHDLLTMKHVACARNWAILNIKNLFVKWNSHFCS